MYVMQADISAQDIHWHRGGLKGVIGSVLLLLTIPKAHEPASDAAIRPMRPTYCS